MFERRNIFLVFTTVRSSSAFPSSSFAATWLRSSSLQCLVDNNRINPSRRLAKSALFSDITGENSTHAENNGPEMVRVLLEAASGTKVLNFQKGEVLRSGLLKRGISPHNGRSRLINCRGLGTCGTCAVEVCGKFDPAERTTKERLRLNFPPHGSQDQSSNLRLACQLQVQGNITVMKRNGFWGQDSPENSVAKDYDEAELWFGELEYILDAKSPQQK
jgi:ferredoxin